MWLAVEYGWATECNRVNRDDVAVKDDKAKLKEKFEFAA